MKNHPVLLALSDPRLEIGAAIKGGRPIPALRAIYPRLFPEGVDLWWRFLSSPSATWNLLCGHHRFDTGRSIVSLNANATAPEARDRSPAFAATAFMGRPKVDAFAVLVETRGSFRVVATDGARSFTLDVIRESGIATRSTGQTAAPSKVLESRPTLWSPENAIRARAEAAERLDAERAERAAQRARARKGFRLILPGE